MTQNFTLNDLIRLLYNETTIAEEIALREAMDIDWELKEEYLSLKEAYDSLTKTSFSPSSSSVKNILKYSKEVTLPSLV